MMGLRIIIFFALMSSQSAWAIDVEGVSFAPTRAVNGKTLILNGAALRTKRKFGINFKVYVAGLWVPTKSSDPNQLMKPGDKILELVFLRSLDKDTMTEAWTDSFKKNCQLECESGLEFVKTFNDFMVDVKESSLLTLTFDKAGVSVEVMGKKENKKGRVDNAAFSRNLMAAFIGPAPPTEEFKKGLLGL